MQSPEFSHVSTSLITLTILLWAAWFLRIWLSHMELRQALGELQQHLQSMEGIMQRKDEFVAILSHEIRNPLNAVIGLIRNLESDRPLNSEVTNALRSAANYMESTVEEVLNFSEMMSGKQALKHEVFAVGSLINLVSQIYRHRATAKGLQFDVSIHCDPQMQIEADRSRLQLAFGNLVNNAIKFTQTGSVLVEIDILEVEAGQSLRIHVRDSGPGIPESEQLHLFEPAQRSQRKRSKLQGKGLGLPLVRALVHQMGGLLNLHSSPGNGSDFSLLIPVQVQQIEADPVCGITPSFPSLGLHVLVVEDLEFNRILFNELANTFGCTTVPAENARAAIALAQSQHFDAIVTDWDLPDMSGAELVTVLRASEAIPAQTRMIGISALPTPEVRQLCLDCGMHAFLTKPFRREDLYLALANGSKPLHADKPSRSSPHDMTPVFIGSGLLNSAPTNAFTSNPRHRWLLIYFELRDQLASLVPHGSTEAIRKAAHALLGHLAIIETQHIQATLLSLQDPATTTTAHGLLAAWQQFLAFEQRMLEEWSLSDPSSRHLIQNRGNAQIAPTSQTMISKTPRLSHSESVHSPYASPACP